MFKKITCMLLLCYVAFALSGSTTVARYIPATTPQSGSGEDMVLSVNISATIPESSEINIVAVGDVMVHGPQLKAQYDSNTSKYNFSNNFLYVRNLIEKADIACCNLETTFAGEEKGYSSYPMFNTPDNLAEALKQTGFDILATANNHTIDSGIYGVKRTIRVLENQGLKPVGTRMDITKDNFLIHQIKDISVGFSAFTYETPKYGQNKTLNALVIPKEAEALINTFSYETLENDLNKMKNTVEEMKRRGAELVVLYLHWGNEYQRQPDGYQQQIAKMLSEYGVDIIFGSHPHVLQPMDFITNSKGEETLVIYSLGNFLSNQRYEILKNRYTEDGIIVDVKVKKDFATDEIEITKVEYTPTWIHKYVSENKSVYEILPLVEVETKLGQFNIDEKNNLWRAENSRRNTIELITQNTDRRIKVVSSISGSRINKLKME